MAQDQRNELKQQYKEERAAREAAEGAAAAAAASAEADAAALRESMAAEIQARPLRPMRRACLRWGQAGWLWFG